MVCNDINYPHRVNGRHSFGKVQTISCNNLSDENYKAFDMCCSIGMIVLSSNLFNSIATSYWKFMFYGFLTVQVRPEAGGAINVDR